MVTQYCVYPIKTLIWAHLLTDTKEPLCYSLIPSEHRKTNWDSPRFPGILGTLPLLLMYVAVNEVSHNGGHGALTGNLGEAPIGFLRHPHSEHRISLQILRLRWSPSTFHPPTPRNCCGYNIITIIYCVYINVKLFLRVNKGGGYMSGASQLSHSSFFILSKSRACWAVVFRRSPVSRADVR